MIYNIPPARRGDTWDGINSISVKVSGIPINFSDCEVSMQFRQSVDSPVALTLSTTNSAIQILTPAATAVRVLPFVVDIPFAKYYYDFQVKTPAGYIKTYMAGYWPIVSDVTV
jgi:hypothetical protein